MTLLNVSSTMLFIAFMLYLVATIFFGATISDKRTDKKKKSLSGNIGITRTIIGLLAQLTYFITRWIASGHALVSNLFEFSTFLGMAIVLVFFMFFFIY